MSTHNSRSNSPDRALEDGRKVFVGNLSFYTTNIELKEYFASIGKVETANIITRGTRSAGYGFITFETAADAQKAVADLDKSELAGRTINLELAKAKEEGGEPRRRSFRGRGRGSFRRGRGSYRGGRGGHHRSSSKTDAVDSADTIFVSNLPYSLTEEAFKAHFKDFQVKETKIVRRVNGSSRGFGFVTFESNEHQKQALAKLDQSECEGRVLTMKVAHAIEKESAEAENQ